MVYRYNKGFFIHLLVVVVALIVLIIFLGVTAGTLIILVFCVWSTVMFNCYKIVITEDNMVIYQIYGGRTTVLWDEVETIEIGMSESYIPRYGVVKNMTVKFYGQKDFEVNIEPVEREEMIKDIESRCKIRGIFLALS